MVISCDDKRAHTHTHDRRTPSSSSPGETALLRVHLLRSRPAARLDPHSPTGPAEAWGETAQTVGVQWRTGQRERGGQKDSGPQTSDAEAGELAALQRHSADNSTH